MSNWIEPWCVFNTRATVRHTYAARLMINPLADSSGMVLEGLTGR